MVSGDSCRGGMTDGLKPPQTAGRRSSAGDASTTQWRLNTAVEFCVGDVLQRERGNSIASLGSSSLNLSSRCSGQESTIRSPTFSHTNNCSSSGTSRRASFLSHGSLHTMDQDNGSLSPMALRSGNSMASVSLCKSSTMRARPKSILSDLDSMSADATPLVQKRYQDVSRGTVMANMNPSARAHRQLRPLRKGVVGLSETDLLALGERLRFLFYDSGIIKNRRWRLISHPAAFVALDAVEWLVSHGLADTQQQAVTIMTCMQRNGIIFNLCDERSFTPANIFFRFRADDTSRVDVPSIDLVDCHTSNQLRTWVSTEKHIVAHHNRGNKVYPLSFVPSEFVACLVEMKECQLDANSVVSLCQILQESRCLVQIYPARPSKFTDCTNMLFRFREDHISLKRAREVDHGRMKKSSNFLPRWMSATESLSAAVRSPVLRAKMRLLSRRRTAAPDRGQVYRPEIWDGSKLQLVASLKDEWGFTLTGTTPVRVLGVDHDGPARKLLQPGDIVLQIDDLDVFRMTGSQVMGVIREGKPFLQVTIHQRPEPPPPIARPRGRSLKRTSSSSPR